MSGKPGDDLDCAELLDRLFLFIDNEMDATDCSRVRQHLEQCPPCAATYQLDCAMKTLVQRSCCEQAPLALHERVLGSIRGWQGPVADGPALPWERR